MRRHIGDAEKFLNVPHGTIATTISDPDFVFVLKICGVIEPILRKAVQENVRKAIEHPKTATSGSESLIKDIGDLGISRLCKILYEFGALDAKTHLFISALFDIRNRYAHNIINAPLSVAELCHRIGEECGGDKQLLRKLIGWDAARDPPVEFIDHLRILMFFNIAVFLRDAVQFVNPPPLLTSGLLSQAFSEISDNRNSEHLQLQADELEN